MAPKAHEQELLIPGQGGYEKLKSFQVSQVVYDVTVRFCERYIDRKSRTNDQMVQAARSGVQNIAEGSKTSGTSRKSELRLTNVARASLEELKLDYLDFLRHRALSIWPGDDARRQRLVDLRPRHVNDFSAWVNAVHDGGPQTTYREISANGALVLINVACSLLDRQIASQAKRFEEEGGFSERLYRVRKGRRGW